MSLDLDAHPYRTHSGMPSEATDAVVSLILELNRLN